MRRPKRLAIIVCLALAVTVRWDAFSCFDGDFAPSCVLVVNRSPWETRRCHDRTVYSGVDRSPNELFMGVIDVKAPWMGKTIVVATLKNSSAALADWNETAELVLRAQNGDRDAYGQLVEQFERTIYSVCLGRLGNASEALELTQDVFLHVMNRLDQLREPERFAGWLRQVAVRMAINRATRRVAPPSVEADILEGAGARHDDPLDALISRERAERLWAGLERLKTLDRETLVAFYIEGDSLIEIADRLNTPIGTIKRRLHTARKRLKAELQEGVHDADEWSDRAVNEFEDAESDDLALV